jgi:two-component system sensor histidine kinase MtrB
VIARLLPSLRARVLLGTVLVVLVTALGAGGATALSARSWAYQDAQDAALATFTDEMAALRDNPMDVPADVIVTVGGEVIADPRATADLVPTDLRANVDRNPTLFRFERLSSERIAIGYQPGGDFPTRSYFVVRPLLDVSERLNHLMTILAAAVAGSVVLGIALGAFVVRSVVRPLKNVESAAKRIAAGDDGVRMPPTDVRELQDVTASLNDMLDEQDAALTVLKEEEQRAQRFVADVSHELRSPLAAMVPAAEVLQEELADDPGFAGRAASLVSREVTAMAALVEDLLEMTRRDAGLADVSVETVDVLRVLTDALDRRGWSDVEIRGSTISVSTDPRRLVAVVTNLVGNAVRHGASPVSVHISHRPGVLTIAVVDRGPGVPAEHVSRIFERLYKASDARTRTGGAGLGLAIARENAQLLGGDVRYLRTDVEGSPATVFVAEVADSQTRPPTTRPPHSRSTGGT